MTRGKWLAGFFAIIVACFLLAKFVFVERIHVSGVVLASDLTTQEQAKAYNSPDLPDEDFTSVKVISDGGGFAMYEVCGDQKQLQGEQVVLELRQTNDKCYAVSSIKDLGKSAQYSRGADGANKVKLR